MLVDFSTYMQVQVQVQVQVQTCRRTRVEWSRLTSLLLAADLGVSTLHSGLSLW